MIQCPNCQHAELIGALFCSECGAQLSVSSSLNTKNFGPNPVQTNGNVEIQNANHLPAAVVETTYIHEDPEILLNVMDSGRIIHLRGRTEYSLGRISEGQPILPDVDLSEFNAYAQGVSRLHSTIKVGQQRISIMDLGSSNGTRVNGQKIVPHVDYPVKNNDMIALGKMRIQIIIQK